MGFMGCGGSKEQSGALSSKHDSSQVATKKLVLLGDSGVGKTALFHRYISDEWKDSLENTIGASYLSKEVDVGNGTILLNIWDTAGQERYKSLAPMYFRGSHAALIVFDLTSLESFQKAKEWLRELRVNHNNPHGVVIGLAGNKLDLVEANGRAVSSQAAKAFAEEEELVFMEVSAKTGHNISQTFETLARRTVNLR